MPEVTVWLSPKGLPIATTKSPTCIFSESPKGIAASCLASICNTAISVSGSVPINLALNCRLFFRVTKIMSALAITWLLVTDVTQ
jgi:hypothetical protein